MKRVLYLGVICLCIVMSGCRRGTVVDYLAPAGKPLWFSHPVIGDVSFDDFDRGNAVLVHQGGEPYRWPVNCSLFRDTDGTLYAYITRYPYGYWPPEGSGLKLNVVVYRSADNGLTWNYAGQALDDPENIGGAADMTVIRDNDSTYYGCYGWVDPGNMRGGITVAKAAAPEGPFISTGKQFVADDARQELINGMYKRVYAPTIFRRKNDYLILSMMSTPRNLGGSWAWVAMTSQKPDGGFSAPVFVFSPQQKTFWPALMENFSCYERDGYIYVPFTSVAANRNFQLLVRAPIEEAHLTESYEVVGYGGGWHDMNRPSEHHGLWGQQPSYAVAGSELLALYPSLDTGMNGTITFARAPLDGRSGRMYFSGARAPALTFIANDYSEFSCIAELEISGEVLLFAGKTGALSISPVAADAALHGDCLDSYAGIRLRPEGYEIVGRENGGSETVYGTGINRGGKYRIDISRTGKTAKIQVCSGDVPDAAVELPVFDAGKPVQIGLLASKGGYAACERFEVRGEPLLQEIRFDPSVAMLDAAFTSNIERMTGKKWERQSDGSYESITADNHIKFNFRGSRVGVGFSGYDPSYEGVAYLDGKEIGTLKPDASGRCEWDTDYGLHALYIMFSRPGVGVKEFFVAE